MGVETYQRSNEPVISGEERILVDEDSLFRDCLLDLFEQINELVEKRIGPA